LDVSIFFFRLADIHICLFPGMVFLSEHRWRRSWTTTTGAKITCSLVIILIFSHIWCAAICSFVVCKIVSLFHFCILSIK
jgi:hypothetical protein